VAFLPRQRTWILTRKTDSERNGGEYSKEIGTATNTNTSQSNEDESPPLLPTPNKPRHSTPYHFAKLFIDFLALSLSGYILSHSSSTLTSAFRLFESLFGATFAVTRHNVAREVCRVNEQVWRTEWYPSSKHCRQRHLFADTVP
jgi:hypothetical protein